MPIYNGNYVAPVWINDQPPAINETELLAMSQTIQASQVLTGYGPPTQYTSGVAGQRYADMSTAPPTVYKLISAVQDANEWGPEDASGNLAQEYAANTGYTAGDYCLHDGLIYRANTDISGEAWTAAHWTRAYAAEDLADHVSDQNNPHNVTAAQTGALSGTVIATVESSATASQAYSVGQYLILGGTLYIVTAPIAQGGTITAGTNVEASVLGDDVAKQKLKIGSITLSATWQGTNPKYQTVTVTGVSVTADSYVELQPSPAQLSALISGGTKALTVENNNGTLTVYAIGAAPGSAMTVQCTVEDGSSEGGGGATILTGTGAPDASAGTDGMIYLQYDSDAVLPPGYTKVQYITASGSQYIETGVPARQQLKMEADFQYTGSAEATILGGTGASNSVIYLGINPGSSFKSYYFNWAGSWVDVRNRDLTERHRVTVSLESGNILITEDGASIYTSSSTLSGTTAANNLTIFARNGSQYMFVGNLYRLRLWDWLDSGNLIRDYIPAVRDSDDAVGLYELVQGQFCENAGTGTLTAGGTTVNNEIVGTYAKVNGAWQPLIGTSLDDITI